MIQDQVIKHRLESVYLGILIYTFLAIILILGGVPNQKVFFGFLLLAIIEVTDYYDFKHYVLRITNQAEDSG